MAKKKNQANSKGITTDMDNTNEEEVTREDIEAIDAVGSELEALGMDQAESEAGQEKNQALLEMETKLQELTGELESAQAKQEEYLNMAQRVQADFENFRRRNQSVRKEAFEDGARGFVTTLLPVVDNMERAIDAAKESADPSLREGVEMVYRQLMEVFEKRGISAISRLGEKFDPNLENAVLQGIEGDGEPGTVCEVFQKGYQMGEAILRHAMVKVVPE